MGAFPNIGIIMSNVLELMIYEKYVSVYVQRNTPINNSRCHLMPLSPRVPQPTRLEGTRCRSVDWHITSPSIF